MLKIYLRINVLMMSFVLMTTFGFAQSETTKRIFKFIEQNEVTTTGERFTIPMYYKNIRIDLTQLQNHLRTAPLEPVTTARLVNGLLFEMPMPDGNYQRFQIFEYNLLHPDLASKFPQIKTYTGQGIDDASATIKLDITQHGFHAMVRSPNGTVFIDPYNKNTTAEYICYYKKDLHRSQPFSCDQNSVDNTAENLIQVNSGLRTNGTQLRTYRLALSCTGEYAAFFGGTVSGATGGMATTMNRVNGIYEDELSVRMVIVANNNLITYTNSSTDPFTNGNGSTMLGQNQTTCDNIIGSANYDIGHVVSTGGGGVAGLGVVCSSGNKASGVTGSGSPTGDSFDVDYVAHEMGHQFAGSHTFNSATGSCSGNRTSTAAYEPGSGITIQAYAGICGSDNLASNSIAYFHGYSLDQMIPFTTTGTGNNCPVTTVNGNTAPVVTNMAANCSIPISTPFVLTGAATDANGDVLTYSWEERDLGAAGAWNVQSTTAPQFRTFTPTTSPSRTFPKLSDIINNTITIGELLPNQARTLKFRLTARDNRAGGGGIMHPDTNVIVTVVNSGGAFAVTSPNTAVTYAGGSTQTVTWNVSGTTANGINTANVKISLSTDGGNTFPAILSASTANDGTEIITIPNTATTTARIKVEAAGNIFFDMSNTNFTITAAAGLTSITTSAVSPLNYCAGAAMSVSYTVNAAATAGNIFTAQLSSASGSFTNPPIPITLGTLTSTTAGTISCIIPAGTLTGSGYKVRVVSSSPVVNGSDNGANITISGQVGSAGNPQTGSSSYCANIPITFTVSPVINATTYNWTVNAGGIVNSGQGTTQVTIVFPPGQPTTSATVTVSGANANCSGASGSRVLSIFNSPNTPIAGNVNGCAGTSISLSGFPSGGTFSVPNPYTGPSTTYTYNVATFDGCNATSAPANITVNPSPTPTISGNSSFCSGSSIVLDAGAGYASYSWMPGGNTQTIAVTIGSVYQVTVTNANGCSGTSALKTVTENPSPAPFITGNTQFCPGGFTVLNAGAGYSGYSWSNGATTQMINASTAGNYAVTVTNSSGCTGTSLTVPVGSYPPVIAFITGNTTFCTSSSTSLNAGAGFSNYSWSTGATTQSISVSTSNTFTATVTDGNGCTGSASATTTVNPLPSATTSPSGTVSTCNSSQTITAGSGAGYSYQWKLNGSNIGGATLVSYNATVNGNYTVVVTQGSCSATSATVMLTLGTGSPVITSSAGTSICAGSNTLFTAPAGATAYQWYKNNAAQPGATLQTFTASSNGTYHCNVTGTCSGSSNIIVLAEINNPIPVISNTTPLTFCNGGSVLLTSNTFAGVSFQWLKNNVDIVGATSQTYSANSTGTYRVRQTANGCFKNAPAKSVNAAGTSVTASISANGSTTFCSGGSVTLSVDNPITGYSYQWRVSGVNIGGATSTSLVVTSGGSYTCFVTASCGNVSSNTIVVSTGTITATVNPAGTVNVCTGATVALAANLGTGYTYQWKLNGVDIVGATASSYAATAAGNYTVAITSPCGGNTSAATTINFTPLAATVSPSGTSVICAGFNITYTANTGFNYTYQWRRNGGNLAGATNASYVASSNGTYSVVITQAGSCSATSANATLSVTNNPTPTITAGGATTFCVGQSVTLTANTFAGVVYQWEKSGTDIAGATAQNYTATTAGTYKVRETANGCYKSSSSISVTVNCRVANGDVEQSEIPQVGMVINVTPNPFMNEFMVSGLQFSAGDKVQLMNMLGEIVLSRTIDKTTSNFKFQTSNLLSGIYFMQLTSASQKRTIKVIKQ